MAIIVWPVDAIATVPTNTGRMLRQTLAPLLAGATAARPLGARSGVRPGTSATTVTATSTTWTMGLHAGILDLESSGLAGPYAYAVNVAETGAVTAAHATLARVDIVWVRLDDPAESDGSAAPVVVAGYTVGTAASTPAAPATPARCMVLATIQVPASGGGSPTVIWVAPYTVAAGAPTPVWSAADRDAKFPVPYDGLQVYRLDLHVVETYNGTVWTGGAWITPSLASGWANFGSGYQVAGYRKLANGDVELRGLIKSGTIYTVFTLPAGYAPIAHEIITAASGTGTCQILILTSGIITVTQYSGGGSNSDVSLTGVHFSTLA